MILYTAETQRNAEKHRNTEKPGRQGPSGLAYAKEHSPQSLWTLFNKRRMLMTEWEGQYCK